MAPPGIHGMASFSREHWMPDLFTLFCFRGTVLSGISDALTNTASVTSNTDDPDPDDNTVTVIVPKSSSADLSVVKTGVPNPAAAGRH